MSILLMFLTVYKCNSKPFHYKSGSRSFAGAKNAFLQPSQMHQNERSSENNYTYIRKSTQKFEVRTGKPNDTRSSRTHDSVSGTHELGSSHNAC